MQDNIFDKIYVELLAKNLLEMAFPYLFNDLQKSEKPDLQQGDNFGIEVTRVGHSKDFQITSIWNCSVGKTVEEIKVKDRKILQENNPQFNEMGKLISIDPPPNWRYGETNVNRAIQEKLDRLNSPDFNSNFKYNGLFLFYEDALHSTSMQEIITQFNALQLLSEKKFDFLFVWDSIKLQSYFNSNCLSDEKRETLIEKTIKDRERLK